MNTTQIRLNRLIPLLGLALVASALVAAASYADLQRKNHAREEFGAAIDRLCHIQRLSSVLKQIHDGDPATAAQRLDIMLCDDILELNSQLASAGEAERACARDAFAQIARLRPRSSETSAGAALEPAGDQIEAERILMAARSN